MLVNIPSASLEQRIILMLPYIVGFILIVQRTHTHIPRPWDMLHVLLPANPLCFKQIYNRRDVRRQPHDAIMVETEIVSANRGDVVGLGGVREPIEGGQEDARFCDGANIGIFRNGRKVLGDGS